MQILGSTCTGAPLLHRKELLRRFIQTYWLRPENALWMTLRSDALSRYPLEHPSIDLSCGDGVFSFLHFGGEFDPAFDVFTSVTAVDSRSDGRADMFDHMAEDYQPLITSPPGDTIDVGTDVKQTALRKAARLDFYGRLVEHDNNDPLPFEDNAFRAVYCNSAYWVREIDRFLAELARITQPGGHVVLQVKLASLARYTLAAHRAILGDRFLDIIDRGRSECWPSLADRSTWESRFTAANLSIVDATPFVTKTHAHIWDIGLRPIAPLLVKMTKAIAAETRAAIKREWVGLFCELLGPLCEPDLDLSGTPDEPAEIQYVLRPA